MSISLTYEAATLPLDPDLLWIDENDSSAVKSSVDVGLTGALIVQSDGDDTRPGRPITLQPEDDTSAWMIFEDVEILKEWAAIADAEFDLVIGGLTYRVAFRHHEAPALIAKKVQHFRDVLPTDYYLVTLKFMTI